MLAGGMKVAGCWAVPGWSTLFSENTFAASVEVEGSLGLSSPAPDAARQFLGLAGGRGAGQLLPSPSPPGYRPFPTPGLLPIQPRFQVYQSWGMGLSPRTSVVLAWCCFGSRCPPLTRERGLAPPSCVWHLHTWGSLGPRGGDLWGPRGWGLGDSRGQVTISTRILTGY